jgi:hypothetical protein
MKVLMPLVRLGSLVACLASLVATSAGCEHHDRVVVRERPVIVRQRPAYVTVYARPQPVVVQERIIVHGRSTRWALEAQRRDATKSAPGQWVATR